MKLKFTFILILIANLIFGQKRPSALSIGDRLPTFTIPKLINYAKKTASTSEFTENLLILDFWGMGCKTCIEIMPEMSLLEKKIGSKLKILPIASYGKETTILEFWKNNKYLKNVNVPSVVEDTLFHTYFPNYLIPHEVWIYKGIVIAITDNEYVNEQNIVKVLSGENVNWPIKNDYYSFDYSKPLFEVDETQIDPSTIFRYAAISDYKNKVRSSGFSGGSGIIRDSIKKTIRSYFINQPILNTYLIEWLNLIKLDSLILPSPEFCKNQVLWEVNDRSLYSFEKKEGVYSQEWIRKNGICFESLYTDTGQTKKEIHQSIISDMDRLLGLHVRWEKRKENIFVLSKIPPEKSTVAKKDVKYKKYSLNEIVYNLNDIADNPYVFDESGDTQVKIPIDYNTFKDIAKLQNDLRPFGFELKREERIVHRLIFSEVDAGRVIDADMQARAKAKKVGQEKFREITPDDNLKFFEDNKKRLGVKTTSSGLQYKILQKGNGRRPGLNSKVILGYEGRLVNGKIFESTYEKGIPSKISVNNDLKGLTEALQLMNEGSIWEIYIPAELGYGIHTGNGKVAPSSTLIYKLELVRILK